MTSEHPFAVGCLAVMLLLSVAAFPPCVGATSRIMPAAISATGMLRTPRVPQSPVRQLRQVYAPPEQVSESMSQFRAADAALLKRIADGQAEARVEYVNVMKGIIGCNGNSPRADPSLADSSALALRSTSGQYQELEPYLELRDSLIQEAGASVKSNPLTPEECSQYQRSAQQLGIPKTAMGIYGHRKTA